MRANIAVVLIAALCVTACGGGGLGGGTGGGPTPPSPAPNVQAVTVDTGPAQNHPDVNTLFTSVTICAPGSTSNCQTIDHVQVDTASSGLRILSSALAVALSLQVDGSGNAIVECTQFADGISWGPVRTADVRISGESAPGIAVQVIGDPAYPAVPTNCSNIGQAENTVETFGAKGILGVGPFISDCGPGCTSLGNGVYYACSSGSACQDTAVAEAQQVSNPVSFFATDNNGIIIELPSVAAAGAATVSGSLVFGIGTQNNNLLGTATVYTITTSTGSLAVQYNGSVLTDSFIDSGSNAYYFPDNSISVCGSDTNTPGFFCPQATLNLSATVQGLSGASSTINFSVANAATVLGSSASVAAASNLAAPTSVTSGLDGTSTFDLGLPFYFGRSVYTAIETRNTSGGMGPYFAF